MNHYCTLFDSNYMLRGYSMVSSLKEKDPKAFIFVLAFDEAVIKNFEILALDFVKVISLSEFENERLLSIKSTRTRGEYCWTCTPWIIKYCIEKFDLDTCVYVDADLFFFSNPQLLLDEAKEKSILITEHRYSPRYDQTKTSGRFCVQFLKIQNDEFGMEALNWWADRCIEWCYARTEGNKFGDQMYLDDWETRFSKVHVLENLGGGVAPWNLEKYQVTETTPAFSLLERTTQKFFTLIFYHFHEIKLVDGLIALKTNYYFPKENFYIHKFYFKQLKENAEKFLKFGIVSEKYQDLDLCLLEALDSEKESLKIMYQNGKRRLLKFMILSMVIGFVFTCGLLMIQYRFLVR